MRCQGETASEKQFPFLPQVFEHTHTSNLTLSLLLMTQEAFVDNVDQDQTAQNEQSDI